MVYPEFCREFLSVGRGSGSIDIIYYYIYAESNTPRKILYKRGCLALDSTLGHSLAVYLCH